MMLDGLSAVDVEETRSFSGSRRSGSAGKGVTTAEAGGSVSGESSANYPEEQSTSHGTPSITGTSDQTFNIKNSPEALAIAKRETRAVFYWRIVMFGVLITSTIGVAIFVYKFVSGQQHDEYETAYMDDSTKVIESVGDALDVKLGAIDAMEVTIVSYAVHTGADWPQVTIPDFAVRAAKVRSLTGAVALQMYMVVNEEQKEAWEVYTSQNDYWIQEDLDIQRNDVTFTGIKNLADYVPQPLNKIIHSDMTAAVPNADGL
jgi:hypothetical protein